MPQERPHLRDVRAYQVADAERYGGGDGSGDHLAEPGADGVAAVQAPMLAPTPNIAANASTIAVTSAATPLPAR